MSFFTGVKVFPSKFSIRDYIQSHISSSDSEEGKCGHGSSSGLKEENGGSPKKDVVYGCDIDKFLNDLDTAKAKIFTCVGSVRQVKNPMFLMKTFSGWYKPDLS